MSVRAEVRELVRMGPLPERNSVDDDQFERLRMAIERVTPPVTREEAELLLGVFGPDNCRGLVWFVLRLIESAPGGAPLATEPPPDANEWVRFLWKRAEDRRTQALLQTDPVEPFREARRSASDDAILAELTALPVLPDESDPAWDDDRTWAEQAHVFLALSGIAAERRLRAALPLLLERASYGDPYEIMRIWRHDLETIVEPDWKALADVCATSAISPRRGARLWSVRELGILRDDWTLPVLVHALDDEATLVRLQACQSIAMLCQTNRQCRAAAIRAIERYRTKHSDEEELRAAHDALADIRPMKPS